MLRRVLPLLFLLALAGASTASAQEVRPRVIDGQDAIPGELPYQVLLTRDDGGFCGGSIVDPQHVVTAAHCVLDDQGSLSAIVAPSALTVSYGGVNRDTDGPNPDGDDLEDVAVSRVTVDRRYLRNIIGDEYDSAVLTLAAPIAGPNAEAIPLASSAEVTAAFSAAAGDRPTVSGWGLTEPDGNDSEVLQKAQVPLVSDSTCDDEYPDLVATAMLCAGSFALGGTVEDTCQGDSGGPLAIDTKAGAGKTPKLAGITSFGNGCGQVPGVYTEVTESGTLSYLATRPEVDPPQPSGTPTVSGTMREGASASCSAPALTGSTIERYLWVLVGDNGLSLIPQSTATITVPDDSAGDDLFCAPRYENPGGFAYLESAAVGPIAPAQTGGGGVVAPPASPLPMTPLVPLGLSDVGFGGFPRRASLRSTVRRGLAGRISCNADCSFRASIVLPRRSARRAGFRGRTVVVSRVQSSDAAGGSGRRVRFKFKRSVARRLRRLTRGTALELRVTAVDTRGTRRTEKKKLTLKR